MHNTYLLLRNNKQTGPHTLEELRQLGLKGTDLIWIEGKSAGWRNPSDIPELQTAPETPKPNASAGQTIAPTNPAPQNGTAKPLHSKHIHVSFPVRPPVAPPTESKTERMPPAPVPEAEESPEEKLKRKAEELYRKAQAYSAGKAVPKSDTEPETKYARSLDDIKEEYVHWMSEQKRHKGGSGKKAALATGLLLLLLAGGYFGKVLLPGTESSQKDAYAVPSSVPEGSREVLQQGASGEDREVLPSETVYSEAAEEKERIGQETANVQKGATTGVKRPEKVKATAPQTIPADKEEEVVLLEETERAIQERAPETGTERKATKRGSDTEPLSPAAIARQIRISEKERDESEGRGITGLQLTVYNNSKEFVNVVAVDVYYYKGEDRLLQKKTLYFNNIPPGSSSSLPAPDNRRATSVNYQLGLISSAGGLYYAKQ